MKSIEKITINGEILKDILEKHGKWLKNIEEGEKANLNSSDLRYADLSNSDLSNADLSNSDLSNADLSNSDLSNADLRHANLRHADLRYVDLSNADLSNADLRYADLRHANLIHANLSDADLRYANLSYANLRHANLNNIKFNHLTTFLNLQCPEEGSFIGYKKASNKIIKLLITEDAKRSSATSRKCRCSKAKVISITSIDGNESFDCTSSNYDKDFIYEVGKIVEVKDFNEDRWNECSTGIHFFITREEAVNYNI